MWPNKYYCPLKKENPIELEWLTRKRQRVPSATGPWGQICSASLKGCGNQYPLTLKNVYNLWPSNPIHRCTPNKSAYICVHWNICERFPAAFFIHIGPNQKLPRCPSTLEQTNERGDHRTWEKMCSHGNTHSAGEAHKGVHTVEWCQCKRHTVSQGSMGGIRGLLRPRSLASQICPVCEDSSTARGAFPYTVKEQNPKDWLGYGQGSLACCCPQGREKTWLNTSLEEKLWPT